MKRKFTLLHLNFCILVLLLQGFCFARDLTPQDFYIPNGVKIGISLDQLKAIRPNMHGKNVSDESGSLSVYQERGGSDGSFFKYYLKRETLSAVAFISNINNAVDGKNADDIYILIQGNATPEPSIEVLRTSSKYESIIGIKGEIWNTLAGTRKVMYSATNQDFSVYYFDPDQFFIGDLVSTSSKRDILENQIKIMQKLLAGSPQSTSQSEPEPVVDRPRPKYTPSDRTSPAVNGIINNESSTVAELPTVQTPQPSQSSPVWLWGVGLLLLVVTGGVWWKLARN